MNLSMKQNVALGLVVVFGLTLGQAQEIPDRPEKLKFLPLVYDAPNPADYRVELESGAVVYIYPDRERPLIDLSVNETLPRTVMTSITIMLALAALLFLGGHVLRGFTAAMMLGIVVGTYSSIYVSSSLLISLGLSPQLADKKKEVGPPGGLSGGERIS